MNNQFPKMLNEQPARHVVALSESFVPGRHTHLHADVSTEGIELIRYNPDFTLDFRLSADEMDALMFAWTTLQEKLQEARIEKERLLEEAKEAVLV